MLFGSLRQPQRPTLPAMSAAAQPSIYLDHSAAAPLCAAARSAIASWLEDQAGNPSSLHLPGQQARRRIDAARESLAALLRCHPDELIFTSGATEANTLAWLGVARAQAPSQRNAGAITCATEHPSVLAAADLLAGQGWTVRRAPVDHQSHLQADALDEALAAPDSRLVSLMAVNNETGVRHDIDTIARRAHANDTLFHCDATQAVGRLPVDLSTTPVDLLSLSGHKFGAPAGIGALFVRRGTPFEAPLTGHQEHGLRPGTENMPGIIALGAAAAAAPSRIATGATIRHLRDRLWQGIQARIDGATRNGPNDPTAESGHVLNVSFDHTPGDLLAMALDLEGVAVSTGSACTSGTLAPSHVLLAMGPDEATWRTRCKNAIRFSLGPENTEQDIDRVLDILPPVMKRCQTLTYHNTTT